MAQIKQYDTPFERLCLEDRPEFSDPEALKIIEKTYKRKGQLNIGDVFCNFDEIDGFIKITIGRVTGFDKYVAFDCIYRKEDIVVSISEYWEEEYYIIEEESTINKCRLLGKTVFNQKEFIKVDRDFLLKIIWMLKGIEIANLKSQKVEGILRIGYYYEYIDDNDEKRVLAYIEENKEYLESLITDENGKKYSGVNIDIVGTCNILDLEANLGIDEHEGYKTIHIPNTNYYLVVHPYEMN